MAGRSSAKACETFTVMRGVPVRVLIAFRRLLVALKTVFQLMRQSPSHKEWARIENARNPENFERFDFSKNAHFTGVFENRPEYIGSRILPPIVVMPLFLEPLRPRVFCFFPFFS
jgi:hypothetical protein